MKVFSNISYDEILTGLNGVIIGWLLLIFLPRWRATSVLVLLVAAAYAVVYVGLFVEVAAEEDDIVKTLQAVTTLKGLVKLFSVERNVLLGWTHYVVFDLMVGRYIVLDAQKHNIPHIAVVWTLPLTLLAGPLGFLCYMAVKFLFKVLGPKQKSD